MSRNKVCKWQSELEEVIDTKCFFVVVWKCLILNSRNITIDLERSSTRSSLLARMKCCLRGKLMNSSAFVCFKWNTKGVLFHQNHLELDSTPTDYSYLKDNRTLAVGAWHVAIFTIEDPINWKLKTQHSFFFGCKKASYIPDDVTVYWISILQNKRVAKVLGHHHKVINKYTKISPL